LAKKYKKNGPKNVFSHHHSSLSMLGRAPLARHVCIPCICTGPGKEKEKGPGGNQSLLEDK
jgi:hypothetical protein